MCIRDRVYIYYIRNRTRKKSHTRQEELAHIATPNIKHQTPSMPRTRGSSSDGVSAGAISGSEQQKDPVLDVDPPTNKLIDVDEDMSQT